MCGQVKSMNQFHFSIELKNEKNETKCEPMTDFTFHGRAVNCNKFYNYTSLPSVFADKNQQDAARSMDVINQYIDTRNSIDGQLCHKYLAQFSCMLFFPRCPDPQDETTELPFVTGYLIQPCRELAFEIGDTCLDEINFISIILPAPDFFPLRNESTKCYYESVQCDNPPKIENGHAVIMHSSTTLIHY